MYGTEFFFSFELCCALCSTTNYLLFPLSHRLIILKSVSNYCFRVFRVRKNVRCMFFCSIACCRYIRLGIVYKQLFFFFCCCYSSLASLSTFVCFRLLRMNCCCCYRRSGGLLYRCSCELCCVSHRSDRSLLLPPTSVHIYIATDTQPFFTLFHRSSIVW